MDKMITILETPTQKELKRGFGGLYKVVFKGNCSDKDYEAYLSQETYKKKLLEEKLHFEYKVPEKLIDEFSQAVYNEVKDFERD